MYVYNTVYTQLQFVNTYFDHQYVTGTDKFNIHFQKYCGTLKIVQYDEVHI